MSDISNVIHALLNEFDVTSEAVSEVAIYAALRQEKADAVAEDSSSQLALKAESMAFGFCEDYQDEQTGWGTYYGPMMVLKDENGQWFESPSIRQVDECVLEYWQQRAGKAKHPVLRSRYADLVWDFTKKITSGKPDITFAHIVIDSALDIAAKDLCKHDVDTITKLERALYLSLSINDTDRRDSVRDAMIEYEDRVAKDDLCGLWGFSFRNLIGKSKVPLSEDHEKKIISDLEGRLKRTSDSEALVPHAAEHAAMMLSQHYRKTSKTDDVRRVLRIYGRAYVDASEKTRGLVASAWLQKVFEVFHQNGMHDEANALTERIQKSGIQSSEEMHTISTEIKIPQEKIEQFLSEMTRGDSKEVLARFAWYFVPDPEDIEKQIMNLAQHAPFQYIITRVIQDREGRAIAKIGTLEEDLDGHIVAQTSQNMQFSAIFINMLIDKLRADKRLVLKEIIDYLFESPVYDENQRKIIEIGIAAFLRDDQIVAAHVLVPQIEHALRMLMKLTGGPVYKPSRSGGCSLRILDDMLRDKGVTNCLGEKIAHYLRVLLTDQRGWNLRNNICHGLQESNTFEKTMGNRLFHVLLLLAQVREKNDDATDNVAGNDESCHCRTE